MAAFAREPTEEFLSLKRRFGDFFEDFQPQSADKYVDRIGKSLGAGKDAHARPRLIIDVHDLQQFDEKLHQELIKNPADVIRPCLDAAKDAARSLDDGQAADKLADQIEALQVGFTGELGPNKLSPRKVLSIYLNQLVCIVGIVTKCSLVHPKMVRSVHYCQATRKFMTRHYADETDLEGVPSQSNVLPTRDEAQNALTTEIGLCKFVDNQRVTLQELPETAPPGQLPRSTDFVLEGDLVDKCKPGDRVMMTGVYKPLAGRTTANMNGQFRSVVIVNNVEPLSQVSNAAANISAADLREMKDLASKDSVLDTLGRSLAPSIYGHDWIKKALILLLVGGQEKNLSNKTHLRGDINCLLVGDPGVAKSQLLRAVMTVAPLAISTNGRGSTGVGLTAAITTDQETGDRRLEAGAVVLADRGIVCVDEFDKMNDVDRVAIHEVMEQQTVTIAKAGVHTSLNARCSIVAAANPIYGTIDESISLTRNINLPDSLLSRFDLLFVVRDNTTERVDLAIAKHVLIQHQYRATGDDGTLAPAMAEEFFEQDEEEAGEQPRYLKQGLLPGGAADARTLTVPFLRKFLYYCKTKFAKQTLTQDAFEEISTFYVELRQAAATGVVDPRFRPIPVTARLLETIIRLATAHSKLRFSRRIEKADVDTARQLLLRIVDQSLSVEADGNCEQVHGNGNTVALEPVPIGDSSRRTTRATARRASAAGGESGGAAEEEHDLADADGGASGHDENVNDRNLAATVGQKRSKAGVPRATPRRVSAPAPGAEPLAAVDPNAITGLSADAEERLCAAINTMLLEQRYVDEWTVEGVQRWLQEHKSIAISRELLQQYFDRVDQNIPAALPHVLYDVAEKTVHRDY